VDWSRVDLWWGDERFVPADDDDRNDKSTLELLREPLGLPAERVHQMPASDGGADLDQAAAAYAEELGSTVFDICLLGLGPDGHVASLFPGHPSSRAEGTVIAVRDSPKPPPDRLSLTLSVINRSQEVWFVVSGADKAEAAALALTGAGAEPVPGAGAHGLLRTVWLLDAEAASQLPADLLEAGLSI
jgi:6-phosphogluconolactonase